MIFPHNLESSKIHYFSLWLSIGDILQTWDHICAFYFSLFLDDCQAKV